MRKKAQMYHFVLLWFRFILEGNNKTDSLINFVSKSMKKVLALLFCIIPSILGMMAGEPNPTETFLSEKNGLSSDRVLCCMQDSRGFLWIGTASGLDLYDGQQVLPFGHASYCILEVDGKIWSGTENGIWIYAADSGDYSRFTEVTRYGVNIISRVNALSFSEDSVVWIGTNGQGIFLYNTKTGNLTQHSTRTPFVEKIVANQNGRVLVVDKDGLGHWYSGKGDYLKPSGEKISAVTDTLTDREGNKWIPTPDRGLLRISREDSEIEIYPVAGVSPDMPNGQVPIAEDLDGCIFIGLNNKLYVLSHGSNDMTLCGNVSPHGHITRLLNTPDALWIGTDIDGIYRYEPEEKTVRHYHTGANTQALYRTAQGELLVGTNLGLFAFNPSEDRFYPLLNRKNIRIVIDGQPPRGASLKEFELVSQSSVVAMCEDSGHYLYMATSNRGLFRMDTVTRGWEHLVSSSGSSDNLPWERIVSLFRGSDGTIWCGTSGDGLWRLQQGSLTFKRYGAIDKRLSESDIYGMAEDNEGNLWISSSTGLWSLDPSGTGVTPFNIKSGSVLYAADGRLFLGRQDALLSLFPGKLSAHKIIPNTVIREMRVGDSTLFIPPGGRSVQLPYEKNSFSIRLAALSYSNPLQHYYSWQLKGFDRDWNTPSASPSVTYTNVPPGDYVFQVRDCEDTIHLTIRPPWWWSGWAVSLYVLFGVSAVVFMLMYWQKRINRRYETLMKEREEEREKALYKQRIRFFMGLVHEIRTPLTLIRLQHEKDSPRSDDTITRNLDYMQDTINRILTYDKQSSGDIEMILTRLDIREVVSSITGTFVESAASEGIKLDTILADDEIPVNADEDMLSKILTNLLSNALKYTKDHITVSVTSDMDNAVISVTDNGPGVRKDQREKIFGMFYTAPDDPVAEVSGIGVGLAYARQLAQAHGGSIDVEDAVPGGASFVLRIPLLKQASSSSVEPVKVKADSKDRLTVLIVEDNRELRETLQEDLSAWYNIISASNGEEALARLEHEYVDLVVSDVMMPVMDGFQLCRSIKSQISFNHIPVILLTAKVSLDAKSEGMESGANAYMEKPFTIRQLHGQIDNLISLRESFRQSVTSGHFSGTSQFGPETDFINSINDSIEKQISEESFSIEALASDMAMSRTNFFRKFKALTGITPNEYLKNYRLDRSSELISKGARINEAAESVGFTSSSYFAKCFKNRFGVLPKDYLK